jgi:hypothetical protein
MDQTRRREARKGAHCTVRQVLRVFRLLWRHTGRNTAVSVMAHLPSERVES